MRFAAGEVVPYARLQLLVEIGSIQIGQFVESRAPGAQVVVLVRFIVGAL